MTVSDKPAPEKAASTLGELYAQLEQIAENAKTWNRLMTTKAKIAQTPKERIWTLNKTKLYRYVPVVPAEKRHKIPLLLVFAIMNRPHVLDLRPGHSFAEYMIKRGYDVYLLDWGAPGPEDKDMKFDDYALEYLPRVVRKVKAVSGSSEFSMLGWCLGALISTLYAALRPDDGLKNLILLTAPLDFTDKKASGFIRWSADEAFKADKLIDTFGNMPGEMIDYGAKALKPVENYIANYVNLWDNIDNPKVIESWHAMNTWVTEIIPMAGAAYRQLINEFYKENKLINDVIAESDHITPPCQSEGIMDKVGSKEKELFRIRGGHIGIMAGSGAEKRTWPHIDEFLGARSD